MATHLQSIMSVFILYPKWSQENIALSAPERPEKKDLTKII